MYDYWTFSVKHGPCGHHRRQINKWPMPRITSLPPPTSIRSESTMTNCVKSCPRVHVVSSSSSSSFHPFNLLTKVSSSLSKRCLVLMCISTLLLSLFNASLAVAAVGENTELKQSVRQHQHQHQPPPPTSPATSLPTSAQQPHEREASLLLCPQGKKSEKKDQRRTHREISFVHSQSLPLSLPLIHSFSRLRAINVYLSFPTSCIGSKRSQLTYHSLPPPLPLLYHHHVSPVKPPCH